MKRMRGATLARARALRTEMILEDLQHRSEELTKRIELVRSYL